MKRCITTKWVEYRGTIDDLSAEPGGVIGNDTTFGSIHDSQVTQHCVGMASKCLSIHGIEKDQSRWSSYAETLVIISRGVDRYVTEFSTDCIDGNAGSGTEQSEAITDLRTTPFITSSERTDESYILIHDRIWQHVPSFDKVLAQFLPIRRQFGSSTALTIKEVTQCMRVLQAEALFDTSLSSRRSSAVCASRMLDPAWSETRSIGKFSARMEQHTRSCETLVINNSSL